MANFYIGDSHFGHRNIIRYDNRPFRTVTEMDNEIIENWNSVVTNHDTVYIVGDFTWDTDVNVFENLIDDLNGNKILITGNHDKIPSQLRKKFKEIREYAEITEWIQGEATKVCIFHYPIAFWNGQFRNSIHIYAHVHNSHQWNMMENWMEEARALQALPMRAYNVGCMMPWMNYTPRTIEQIIEGHKNWKENK